MENITLNINPEIKKKINAASERLGLSPEKFILNSTLEKIDRIDKNYEKATDYVLNKNRDLYKRLAK